MLRNSAYKILTKARFRLASPLRPLSLLELGYAHRTDKVISGYLPLYDRHLSSLRYTAQSVLEIGIGGHDKEGSGGYSLRMWRDYFPKATIHGIDLVDKSHLNSHRIQTHVCDQASSESLLEYCNDLGFDLIIDDGSHFVPHQITSFESLFPFVDPGGIYIIEDTCGSFMGRLRGEYPVGGLVGYMSSRVNSCYSSCIPSVYRDNKIMSSIQSITFWGNKCNSGGFILIEKTSDPDVPPDSKPQLDAYSLDFESYKLAYPEWKKSKSGVFITGS